MARKTAVEMHPMKDEIELRLARGDTILSISKAFGISRGALKKHKDDRLPEKVTKSQVMRDISSADEIFSIILKSVRYMEKLADSCDQYLQDPENEDLYFMGARAHEVDIIWEEVVGETRAGTPITKRHKDTLQDIIDRFHPGGDITSMKTNHTDPRILIVKGAETLTKQMDTLVQAWKAVDQGKNSFVGTPAWNEVVQVILNATEEYPEVRRKIADGLSNISG